MSAVAGVPYTFIVVLMSACRIRDCCTPIAVPNSSNHDRCVWRNAWAQRAGEAGVTVSAWARSGCCLIKKPWSCWGIKSRCGSPVKASSRTCRKCAGSAKPTDSRLIIRAGVPHGEQIPASELPTNRQLDTQREWVEHRRKRSDYCSFAYSASACFRMEMSGSASFQRVRKSR